MTELSRTMAENMRRFLDGDVPSRDQGKSEFKTKDLVDVFNEALGGRQEKETEEGVGFLEQLLRTIHELGI